MWWKIYFWTIVALAVFTPALFAQPDVHIFAVILDIIGLIFITLGLYAYIFRKNILPAKFWLFFFWINIIWLVEALIYSLAPEAPYIKYLSVLSETDKPSAFWETALSSLLGIPALLALWRLSQNKFRKITYSDNKKNPWAAALMNLFIFGLGYIYIGKRKLFGGLLVFFTLIATSIYAFNFEAHKETFESGLYLFISLSLGMAFAVDAFQDAKRVNAKIKDEEAVKETKKSLKESRIFRYIFIFFFLLFLMLTIIMGVNILEIYFGILVYTSSNGDSFIANTSLYNWTHNASLVLLGASLLLIPLINKWLKNKKLSLAMPIVSVFILASLIVTFSLIDDAYKQNAVSNKTNSTGTTFTEKELLDAINKKRKANKVQELIFEESTCALALIRVKDIAENGTGMFTNSAANQRAIDRIYKENPSIDTEKVPDWFIDFLTYEESVEEAIKNWSEGDAKELFTNDSYKYGCVALKDGFGIVEVGYDDVQVKPPDNYLNESI